MKLMKQQDSNINDSSSVDINLKWLIQIMVVVAISVWGYFGLTERINFIEHDVKLMQVNVEMNSEFRVKWPRGELGSLPDDAEQNMRLNMIEKTIEKQQEKMEDMVEILNMIRYQSYQQQMKMEGRTNLFQKELK
jgi:hypothetical protein